ncbi:hypothetical protein Y032_0673g1393 [Ancylostoma ceylanicum]|uniref:Endonuclease/exonuclease/phosphatase domain-containing protein n=1 Tax=Ancylostoma ceylanicum TaxID=53326 RepID=A0A016WHN3_9BILA|nr:hypothetical protein Y032_0673g1393 [Ancylostoma ceylanicum]
MMFREHRSHLVSYNGNAKTQIDIVLVRYRDRKLVTDAKVVPYETFATQHRPHICTMKIVPTKRMQTGPNQVGAIESERRNCNLYQVTTGNDHRRDLKEGNPSDHRGGAFLAWSDQTKSPEN